jgi:hypothetical protein
VPSNPQLHLTLSEIAAGFMIAVIFVVPNYRKTSVALKNEAGLRHSSPATGALAKDFLTILGSGSFCTLRNGLLQKHTHLLDVFLF